MLAMKCHVPPIISGLGALLIAASLERAEGDGPLYLSSFFQHLSNHSLLDSRGEGTVLDDRVLMSFFP